MTPPIVTAMLDLIAWSEGTGTGLDRGYGVIVSSVDGPASFSDYSRHPFDRKDSLTPPRKPQLVCRATADNPAIYSTASGRYQVLLRFWLAYKQTLRLSDFGQASQDAVAIRMLGECGAIDALQAGDIRGAIQRASSRWASLPGNVYGQPGGHTLQVVLDHWENAAAQDGDGVA